MNYCPTKQPTKKFAVVVEQPSGMWRVVSIHRSSMIAVGRSFDFYPQNAWAFPAIGLKKDDEITASRVAELRRPRSES
jgi:hypothetical protein